MFSLNTEAPTFLSCSSVSPSDQYVVGKKSYLVEVQGLRTLQCFTELLVKEVICLFCCGEFIFMMEKKKAFGLLRSISNCSF